MTKAVLRDVRVAPGAGCNLFSLTRLLKNGYELKGDQAGMTAASGKTKIKFNQMIPAGSGYLLGIRLVPAWTSNMVSLTLPEGSRVSFEAFHSMLGHPGLSSVQQTAKYLGLGLLSPTDRCVECATAKMRQKNFPKENEHRSTVPGEGLCIDTSSLKSKSYGGNKFWSLAVNKATGMLFAFFLAQKS